MSPSFYVSSDSVFENSDYPSFSWEMAVDPFGEELEEYLFYICNIYNYGVMAFLKGAWPRESGSVNLDVESR